MLLKYWKSSLQKLADLVSHIPPTTLVISPLQMYCYIEKHIDIMTKSIKKNLTSLKTTFKYSVLYDV